MSVVEDKCVQDVEYVEFSRQSSRAIGHPRGVRASTRGRGGK